METDKLNKLVHDMRTALEDVQFVMSAFRRFLTQPTQALCTSYWDSAMVALGNIPNTPKLITIDKSRVTTFNPEPDNPDSAGQLMFLSGTGDVPDSGAAGYVAYVAKHGVPMKRVLSDRRMYHTDTLIAPSEATRTALHESINASVASVVEQILHGNRQPLIYVTPLECWIGPDPNDPDRTFFYFHLLSTC